MGLGRFGGGVGVARWLAGRGARVLVTDLDSQENLRESIAALEGTPVELRLGGHDERDLEHCDLLVVNPAVDKRKSAFFQSAVARSIPWTTEMMLFLERCCGRVVGVTGSVGKSTTTAMIGAALEAASRVSGWRHGRVWTGGNIGKSLLDDLDTMRPDDIVVLELSSFQLEDAARLRKSPKVALVTNFRENHLDRHGTLADYAAAKGNIYRFQARQDWLAMPFETISDGPSTGVEHLPGGWQDKPRLYRFGAVDASLDPIKAATRKRADSAAIRAATRERAVSAAPPEATLVRASSTDSRGAYRARLQCRNNAEYEPEEIEMKLRVPGLHNVHNAAGALAVSRMLGVADSVSIPVLEAFAGLAHRLEFVRELRGVRYFNDSKATSPEAAMTSIRAFDCPVVVVVGGSDKGSSFDGLGRLLAERARAVVCMGQTRDRIVAAVERARGSADSPAILTADSFEQAILGARSRAAPGDVVLLAPGCASYDWFKNYEERGQRFKALVHDLA